MGKRVVALGSAQSHYLGNVLRLATDDEILVFNGHDGEWRARIVSAKRGAYQAKLLEATRPQPPQTNIEYLFAPLKQARLDYVVQKAVELGASRLKPVITARTVAPRIKRERVRANAIEAAEQCGILFIPEIDEPEKLPVVLQSWKEETALIFCDESATGISPLAVLPDLKARRYGVLIGPEGGFTDDERELLLAKPFVRPISLGPRIMRADTAAVAALTLVNAVLGDWR